MRLSIKDFAARHGVTPAYVYRLAKDGRVTACDGQIDTDIGDGEFFTNRKRAQRIQHKSAPSADMLKLHQSRAKREFHEANLAAMREQKMASSLVELVEVRNVSADLSNQIRTALECVADKLSDRLAAESDPFACRALINDEIENSLTQLVGRWQAMADSL